MGVKPTDTWRIIRERKEEGDSEKKGRPNLRAQYKFVELGWSQCPNLRKKWR